MENFAIKSSDFKSPQVIVNFSYRPKLSITNKHELILQLDRKFFYVLYKTHILINDLTLFDRVPSMATIKPTPQASCSLSGSYKPCLAGGTHGSMDIGT